MAEAAPGRIVTAAVAAPTLAPPSSPSPLAAARLLRQLTVEEAARRAGLRPEEVEWLEEGRGYRFRTTDEAPALAGVYPSAPRGAHPQGPGLARPPRRLPPAAAAPPPP